MDYAYSPFIQLLVIVYLLHASCVQVQGIMNKVNMRREDSERARMDNKSFYMLESNMSKKVTGRVGAAAVRMYCSQQCSLPLLFQWQFEQLGFLEAWVTGFVPIISLNVKNIYLHECDRA